MLSVQNYFYFCAHCKLSRTKIPSAAFSHSYKRPFPDFGSHQRLPSAPNFLVCLPKPKFKIFIRINV